jgi:manganese/zinc/iron transport system ATP- binding protein
VSGLLDIRDLTVRYGERVALAHVTWSLAPGLTAILGPNGAGKSTLLKAALGLVPVVSGGARFFGAPLGAVRARVAYLPQRAAVDWDFPASALDVVCMARYPRMRWWGRVPQREREAAMAALAELGMAELADRPLGKLSGGQQQRVFLARALAQEADLFLMDEPLAAVDATTEAAILATLHHLARAGKSVAMVHHDLSAVEEHFDHVLLLAGRVVAAGPVRRCFTAEAIAEAFGARAFVPAGAAAGAAK